MWHESLAESLHSEKIIGEEGNGKQLNENQFPLAKLGALRLTSAAHETDCAVRD